jgi:hypothetical protein
MTTTPTTPQTNQNQRANFAIVTVLLPGPNRKRMPAPYQFNVSYRNPEPAEPGCVMTWQVNGGREEYQVALERTERGEMAWHCTCPDSVYSGENDPDYCCKHVQGLQALLKSSGARIEEERVAA